MNKIELEVALLRSGIRVPELAAQIGMDKSTFYRKLSNGKFERAEIIKIRDTLRLEDADMLRIFFDESSCENVTEKEENT